MLNFVNNEELDIHLRFVTSHYEMYFFSFVCLIKESSLFPLLELTEESCRVSNDVDAWLQPLPSASALSLESS